MTNRTGLSQSLSFYKMVFAIAAAYDIILGAAFIFLYDPILDALDITQPDNASYIHLAAVFVLVQGVSYVFAWQDLFGNVGLIRTGIIYKGAYFLVAFYYLVTDDLLHWVFFAFGVADLGFMLLFIGALTAIRANRGAPAAS
ncbi:MAG: hypothetical protein AB7J35_13245 [Dehalococcoidia bacterium]